MPTLMLLALALPQEKLFSSDKLVNLAEAGLYSVMGALIFIGLFWLVDKITPYSLWKELLEEHNSALAILLGSCALALGIIIASAIHG